MIWIIGNVILALLNFLVATDTGNSLNWFACGFCSGLSVAMITNYLVKS